MAGANNLDIAKRCTLAIQIVFNCINMQAKAIQKENNLDIAKRCILAIQIVSNCINMQVKSYSKGNNFLSKYMKYPSLSLSDSVDSFLQKIITFLARIHFNRLCHAINRLF